MVLASFNRVMGGPTEKPLVPLGRATAWLVVWLALYLVVLGAGTREVMLAESPAARILARAQSKAICSVDVRFRKHSC